MKNLFTLIFSLSVCLNLVAQTPEKMSYQAVIRDSNNDLVQNTSLGMRISILQGSAAGSSVYVETHSPTTNANGLVTLEIGTGSVISGTFSNIDWGSNTFFVKTETDINGGTNYTITGTSQLMSVPYALHAKTADSVTGGGGSGGVSVVTKTQRDALTPTTGQVVYQTDVFPGLYAWNGTDWRCQSGDCPITFISHNSSTITLDGTHHTIYISGSWEENEFPEPIQLPAASSCPGRVYRIVTNNSTSSNPVPAGAAYGITAYLKLSTPTYTALGFSSPTDVLPDGRALILKSDGGSWYEIGGDLNDPNQY